MVSEKTSSSLNRQSSFDLPQRILQVESSDFHNKFNLLPFTFSHNLAKHPLFEIPRLVELSRTVLSKGGASKITGQVGNILPHYKWSDIPSLWTRTPSYEQLAETILQMPQSQSWVVLKTVQLDPEYSALLEQIIHELEELTSLSLRKEITWLEAYIFMAAPHTITPYHIDHESTFLFQVCGERDVSLFDPRDRSILTEQEIESYYMGNLAAANYQVANQSKAFVERLTPGKGVHHPVRAPHWYKNGNSFSVAFTVHLCLRSYDLQARVYQINHYLRQLRLAPTPPGHSTWGDNLKMLTIGAISKRKPEDKFELLRSGVQRINTLSTPVRRFAKKLKR